MHEHRHDGHDHDHGGHGHDHDHHHAAVDPSVLGTEQGIRAVIISFGLLILTALLQAAVVLLSGSVALLADTIHNFGDAFTAVPLYVAFRLGGWLPTKRFTYGYGRAEDLAGLAVVLTILASAVVAGYESIERLVHPQEVRSLWAVAAASLIGFAGNEAVAVFRIRVGRAIGSAALVADGHHARVDGLTSLAVLLGAAGVYLGFPLADPLIGLAITVTILGIVRESGKSVLLRMLDAVEPERVDAIRETAGAVAGVRAVSDIRARWVGHRLEAEVSIALDPDLPVGRAHAIAVEARRHLLDKVPHLGEVTIHVDPADAAGNRHHLER